MKASIFYRIAAVILVLFDVGHTLGFRQTDPSWGLDPTLSSMRSIHFNAMGFNRTYMDFFEGLGFHGSVFLLFAAILAWQLGGLSAETLSRLRVVRWAFALSFAGLAVLSWRYLFAIPLGFSLVSTVLLAAAAWLPGKSS